MYSFVMPAYKGTYLREAISSILGQSYTDFELIVVDDASPENLEDIVNEYDDSRLTYYRNESNIGRNDLVEQWKHSLTYASGDIVILASDDDVYDRHFLAEIHSLAILYPEINIFRSRVRRIDAIGDTIKEEVPYDNDCISLSCFLKDYASGRLFSGMPQYAFRSSALLENGGFVKFPLGWYSDDATAATLATNGIAITTSVLFSFRDSGINISSSRNNFLFIKKKTDASLLFIAYMNTFLSTVLPCELQEDLLNRLVHRVKDVEDEIIDELPTISFIKSLAYIRKLNTSIFPFRWRVRRIITHLSRTFQTLIYHE